jgi:hypothetical protein
MSLEVKGIIGLIVGTFAVIGLALFFQYGLTDAGRAKIKALGDSARVTCYSGARLIFDACSTGKVHSEDSSDGYFFEEKKTGLPVEVSGNCVIIYQTTCPTETIGVTSP